MLRLTVSSGRDEKTSDPVTPAIQPPSPCTLETTHGEETPFFACSGVLGGNMSVVAGQLLAEGCRSANRGGDDMGLL